MKAKTELLKHFQKVYNEELNESVKISNEEIRYFIEEHLLNSDISLKKVSDRLIEEILNLNDSSVASSKIKEDENFTFKRDLVGYIKDNHFLVTFRREMNGNYFIKFGYSVDCKEQIKELIKSIEPKAIVN